MNIVEIIRESLRAKIKLSGDFREQAPASWDEEYAQLWSELQAAQHNKTAYRMAYEQAINALESMLKKSNPESGA